MSLTPQNITISVVAANLRLQPWSQGFEAVWWHFYMWRGCDHRDNNFSQIHDAINDGLLRYRSYHDPFVKV